MWYHIAFLVPRGGGPTGPNINIIQKAAPAPFWAKTNKLRQNTLHVQLFGDFHRIRHGRQNFHLSKDEHFHNKSPFLRKKGERVFGAKKKGSRFQTSPAQALFGEDLEKAEPAMYSGAAWGQKWSQAADDII